VLIPTPDLNKFTDYMSKYSLRLIAAAGQTYGMGEPGVDGGAASAAIDLESLVAGFTDLDLNTDYSDRVRTLKSNTSGIKQAGALLEACLVGLDSDALEDKPDASVVDFETLCDWLNTGTTPKNQALLHPHFSQSLFPQIKGIGIVPSIGNCFFEVLQGATYANALRKLVVGTGQTAGFAIDQTKYAGGVPYVLLSGLTGTGLVTVTGTQWDPVTKTFTAGKTWTVTPTANGLWKLVSGGAAPASADALIVAVSDITAAAGITAGTIYIEAYRPVLRSTTATAGGATTVTLAAGASAVNDFYKNLKIGHSRDFYAWRLCSAYDGNTRIATVSSAWTTNPQNGDIVDIMRLEVP
jgi:hypothetical protein